MSLRYTIQVSKDHAQVTAVWDISVDMSDTEVISSFELMVEGKALNTHCSGGNKACADTAYATLANPSVDCPVTFVITMNHPNGPSGDDVLRGGKIYDDVYFSS